jgi:hypothetical protein
MTAATNFRVSTDFAGMIPSMLTLPVAANTFLVGNTLVSIDANGRATPPTDGDGLRVAGVITYNLDNRTTGPYGGTAGAVNADVTMGVFALACTDTDLQAGDLVFAVDNQTVSKDSADGTRGLVGIYCSTADDGKKYFYVGSLVPSMLKSAKNKIVEIPLAAFRVAAGTMPGAFSDGVSDGFVVNEGVMFRWNVNSTAPIWATIPLDDDIDETDAVTVHALVSREGSSDTDAVVTVGAYFQVTGAAYTADTNAGGNTGAITAATTVVQEVTRSIAATDVPSGPCSLSISLVPSAALNADDLNLHAAWITYTAKG